MAAVFASPVLKLLSGESVCGSVGANFGCYDLATRPVGAIGAVLMFGLFGVTSAVIAVFDGMAAWNKVFGEP